MSNANKETLIGKRVIYVGSLAECLTECQLRDLFSPYGKVVRTQIVRHKYTSKSAGYGFVEMDSGEEALRAVLALEGTEFAGHCLRLYVTPYTTPAPVP